MAELLLHGGERLGELGVHLRRELLDERLEVVDRLLEVAALLAQEGGALAELGALRLGQRIDRADALAAALEALELLARAPRLGLVGRRREPGLVELLADLVERRRELAAAILEARHRHLHRGAPLRRPLQLAAQRRLALGQRAQPAAVETATPSLAASSSSDDRRVERRAAPAHALDRAAQHRPRGGHLGERGARAPRGVRDRRRRAAAPPRAGRPARSAAPRRSSSSTRAVA